MAEQTSFGWTIHDHRRREQEISRVRLPRAVTVSDGTVGKPFLIALLRRLNHYSQGDEWCFPSQDLLADDIGCSVKHLRRCVRALERLSLLETKRRKHPGGFSCIHYRVEWGRVRKLGEQTEHPEIANPDDEVTGHGVPSTGLSVRSTGHAPDGVTGHGVRVTGHGVPPTGHSVPLHNVDVDVFKGTPPTQHERAEYSDADRSGEDGDAGVFLVSWGRRLSRDDLTNVETLRDELFPKLVIAGRAKEIHCEFDNAPCRDLVSFVALARHFAREEIAGRVSSAVAVLTHWINGRQADKSGNVLDWRSKPSCGDEDWAKEQLAALDRAEQSADLQGTTPDTSATPGGEKPKLPTAAELEADVGPLLDRMCREEIIQLARRENSQLAKLIAARIPEGESRSPPKFRHVLLALLWQKLCPGAAAD